MEYDQFGLTMQDDGMHELREKYDLVLFGTGDLSNYICCALSTGQVKNFRVAVVGRHLAKASMLCTLARAMGCDHVNVTTFDAYVVDVESLTAIYDFLTIARPKVVLGCQSLQSPWETAEQPSRWTDLLSRVGFGITVPFQAVIAARIHEAIKMLDWRPVYLNACFPDAVNPLLNWDGGFFGAGIGNICTVASFLATEEGSDSSASPPRLLAHHSHLGKVEQGVPEVRLWRGNMECRDIGVRLSPMRALPRRNLNRIAGASAALVIEKVLTRQVFYANLPGPEGLPGGYPVRFDSGVFALDLPVGISEEVAISFNHRAGICDGIEQVECGQLRFTPEATDSLKRYVGEYSDGFDFLNLSDAFETFHSVREELRQKPAVARNSTIGSRETNFR